MFQCCVKTLCALERSWSAPNVHSSTIFPLPVLSNKLGVIHGWDGEVRHITAGGDESIPPVPAIHPG